MQQTEEVPLAHGLQAAAHSDWAVRLPAVLWDLHYIVLCRYLLSGEATISTEIITSGFVAHWLKYLTVEGSSYVLGWWWAVMIVSLVEDVQWANSGLGVKDLRTHSPHKSTSTVMCHGFHLTSNIVQGR